MRRCVLIQSYIVVVEVGALGAACAISVYLHSLIEYLPRCISADFAIWDSGERSWNDQ